MRFNLPTLIILRGLPGSGKSTFAKKAVADAEGSMVRVNRDDLRESLFGSHGAFGSLSYDLELEISRIEKDIAKKALKAGKDVIVDALNLRSKYVKQWMKLALDCNATYYFNDDFLKVSVDQCVTNDRMRFYNGGSSIPGRHVGENTIRSLAKKFNVNPDKDMYPPIPVLDETSGEDFPVYTGTPNKPDAILVDIDGTVALMGERGPFEWDKVLSDQPNQPVINLLNKILCDIHDNPYKINPIPILVSGRNEVCRQDTLAWLKSNLDFDIFYDRYYELFMRADGDNRQDAIIKNEIFETEIKDNYNVIGAFDDRQQVVNMYRSKGIQVYQVAEGNF